MCRIDGHEFMIYNHLREELAYGNSRKNIKN